MPEINKMWNTGKAAFPEFDPNSHDRKSEM
jgi:hypothetical protein